MDIIHPEDSNRILLDPKHGYSLVNRMLVGGNLLLLPSSSCFSFSLFKKEEGEGLDVVRPRDSNKILLSPKCRHSMVNGILMGEILSLVSSS